jgi:hypothetical protein
MDLAPATAGLQDIYRAGLIRRGAGGEHLWQRGSSEEQLQGGAEVRVTARREGQGGAADLGSEDRAARTGR